MPPVSRKVVRTAKQWEALTDTEKAARRRALDVLSIMREEGIPLTPASEKVGTSVATAKKYLGSAALRRDARRRIVAKSSDRLFRRLPALTTKGLKQMDFTDSRQSSVVGRYWNEIGHGLNTGDWSGVATFKGKKVRGRALETDPDVIEARARRGELDFEDIYELTT